LYKKNINLVLLLFLAAGFLFAFSPQKVFADHVVKVVDGDNDPIEFVNVTVKVQTGPIPGIYTDQPLITNENGKVFCNLVEDPGAIKWLFNVEGAGDVPVFYAVDGYTIVFVLD